MKACIGIECREDLWIFHHKVDELSSVCPSHEGNDDIVNGLDKVMNDN